MLAYTAGDGLQAISRTYGFTSTAYQPAPAIRPSQRRGRPSLRQALSRLLARH